MSKIYQGGTTLPHPDDEVQNSSNKDRSRSRACGYLGGLVGSSASLLPDVVVLARSLGSEQSLSNLQTDADAYGGRARQQRGSKKIGFAKAGVSLSQLQSCKATRPRQVHSLAEKRVKKKRHRRSPAKRRIVGDSTDLKLLA
jgi:hypothetical protein